MDKPMPEMNQYGLKNTASFDFSLTQEKHPESVWTESWIIIDVQNLGDKILCSFNRLCHFVEAITAIIVFRRWQFIIGGFDLYRSTNLEIRIMNFHAAALLARPSHVMVQLNFSIGFLHLRIGAQKCGPFGRHLEQNLPCGRKEESRAI